MKKIPSPFREGALRALPIALGYVPVGFAYGVLAVKAGIPPALAVLLSITLYAGSGQFVFVNLWAAGMGAASIALTVMVVNLRHLLMSAALSPHLTRLSLLQKCLFAYEITDETFAMHISAFNRGRPANLTTLFSCNALSHASWVFGGAAGAVFGSLLRDVRPYGLDYALIAMFIALLAPMCVRHLHTALAIFAMVLSVALKLAGLGQWSVILATLATATLGVLLAKRLEKTL